MKIKYPAEQAVSVWIGTFSTENDFDKSVGTDVAGILNLRTPIESICEISFEIESVQIRQLIEGFSGWETFIDDAESAAVGQSLEKANAALVCYYLRCDEAPTLWGRLHFLGTFSGQDVH